MNDKTIENIIESPKGFWNSINPFTRANKNYKKLQEIELNKNRTHIQRMEVKIQKILKWVSHSIGYTITILLTASPWIYPIFDVNIGLAHMDSSTGHIYLTWWDHVGLTILPGLTHFGLWMASRPSKIVKGTLAAIPVIIASPYIIYKYFTKKETNPGIRWHKKECDECKIHSNKIVKKEK